MRPATIAVDSSGRPTGKPCCQQCHEALCAREWRGDVWTRTMQ